MKAGIDRNALSRVIAMINGKGGVGKTTLTAHVAGELARQGYEVLVVDMDPGAGLATDLGYQRTGVDDEGHSLRVALETGATVRVIKGVRENLDVIVGGEELFDASHHLASRVGKKPDPRLALARVLSPIADPYDIVLLDCPPGDDTLQNAALSAARWAIVPTRGDTASKRGMRGVERRLEQIVEINPDIDLLGVTLFDIDVSATMVQRDAREDIAEVIGEVDDAFTTYIRHAPSPAQQARRKGCLVYDLKAKSPSAKRLVEGYQALTQEIVDRLIEREEEEQA